MGFDWIDDALEAGEKLPGIGGGLHYLRQLYQLVRIPAVDRTPFHTMAQIHSDLHTTHQSLTTEFEKSIRNLQSKWHGDAATAYLGAGLLAPEQLTPGADVAGTATAQKMQMSLAQIDEVLAYNGGANSAIADALAQIAQAQEALDGVMVGVAEGVGIEVGSIALDEIGVGEVIQGVEGVQLVNDVDEAIQTGEALKNVVELADVGEGVEGAVQTVKVVDEVEQISQVAKFAQFATKTIQYVMAISFITSVVGVPLVEILGQLWVPPGGLGDTSQQPQPLTQTQQDEVNRLRQKFPNVSPTYIEQLVRANVAETSIEQILSMLQAQQMPDFATLLQEFPNDALQIAQMLNAGFTPDQIRAILKQGYSFAQIQILMSAGCTPAQLARYASEGISVKDIGIVCQRIQAAKASATGVDAYGVPADAWPTYLDRLARVLELYRTTSDKNTRRGYKLEIDAIERYLGILVNIRQDIYRADNSLLTDIDVETKCAIIQVTAKRNGEKSSIEALLDPRANPNKKTIIMFAPDYSHFGIPAIEALGQSVNITVKVIQSFADLDAYLSSLQC